MDSMTLDYSVIQIDELLSCMSFKKLSTWSEG
jgi:hypothetical protein